VPDIPGFVVNRLLFPYLFDAGAPARAARGLTPEAIDACMTLGAGHPERAAEAARTSSGSTSRRRSPKSSEIEVPQRITQLVAVGALGRKSGRGFYEHG
jgi:3-hydroxyacyl-CoA dehydrogenase